MNSQGWFYLTAQKLKVIQSSFELDINASQACPILCHFPQLEEFLKASLDSVSFPCNLCSKAFADKRHCRIFVSFRF